MWYNIGELRKGSANMVTKKGKKKIFMRLLFKLQEKNFSENATMAIVEFPNKWEMAIKLLNTTISEDDFLTELNILEA